MSDLISRSALLEEMKKAEIEYENAMMCPSCWSAFTIIREQPTACDVDKIIEELELHSFELGTDTLPVHYVRLNDAIEIVKQGGDNNDICEWKAGKSNDEWQPNCEPNSTYNVFGVAWFKRCPYCGKKIKIVGD